MEVSLEQLVNAFVLIDVTDKGIVYDALPFPIGY